MYQDEEIIVKSATPYSEELEQGAREQAAFVNYVGQTVNVADYVAPYVEHSDEGDDSKLITVSKFVSGDNPTNLFGSPSYSLYYTDEDIVRSIGAYLANFRKASQQFEIDYTEVYNSFPNWDTIGDGW